MYNLSIGRRTFIVVLCTTLILFSMLFLISDLMYMKGYKELENQDVAQIPPGFQMLYLPD